MDYIVVAPIEHDGVRYEVGATFPIADPAVVAALCKAGSLKLREEVEAAATLAQERAALEAENADLKAQLAALTGQQGGKASKKADPAV